MGIGEYLDLFGVEKKQQDGGEKPKFAPDGEHTFTLKEVNLAENSRGKYLAIVYYFPEFNSSEFNFLNIGGNEIDNKKLASFFFGLSRKTDGTPTGIKPVKTDPESLEKEAKKATGWTLRGRKKSTKGKKKDAEGRDKWFRDIYVNEVIDQGGYDSAGTNLDDEIPF